MVLVFLIPGKRVSNKVSKMSNCLLILLIHIHTYIYVYSGSLSLTQNLTKTIYFIKWKKQTVDRLLCYKNIINHAFKQLRCPH